MTKVYLDVGANNGDSCIHLAQHDPNAVVYAFEPTPYLADIIREKTKHLHNYNIIQKAVSDTAGTSLLYISGQADWGCTSLCTFNDNLSKTWPGRTDFHVTNKIEVDVITLESFVKEQRITCIDYLHCDVQGKDLEVLMGLGEYLSIVKTGVIEMPTSHVKKLYKDQKYIAQDAIQFLESKGFIITSIQNNDIFGNEVNIFFRNLHQPL